MKRKAICVVYAVQPTWINFGILLERTVTLSKAVMTAMFPYLSLASHILPIVTCRVNVDSRASERVINYYSILGCAGVFAMEVTLHDSVR